MAEGRGQASMHPGQASLSAALETAPRLGFVSQKAPGCCLVHQHFLSRAWHNPQHPLMLLVSSFFFIKSKARTCLAVQWLRCLAYTARGMSSIPAWGTKILHAMRPKKKMVDSVFQVFSTFPVCLLSKLSKLLRVGY